MATQIFTGVTKMQWAHRETKRAGDGEKGRQQRLAYICWVGGGGRGTGWLSWKQLQLQFNDSCCTLSQNDEAGKCSHMLHLVLLAWLRVCVLVCVELCVRMPSSLSPRGDIMNYRAGCAEASWAHRKTAARGGPASNAAKTKGRSSCHSIVVVAAVIELLLLLLLLLSRQPRNAWCHLAPSSEKCSRFSKQNPLEPAKFVP